MQTVEICFFAAYFDNTVGDAFGLHLYDFASQFGRQLEMIRQVTLVLPTGCGRYFAGRLHVEDKELRVVAGSQPGSLADDLSRRLLLTADASQEFFMPDTCIDGDRALHLLFRHVAQPLSGQVRATGECFRT